MSDVIRLGELDKIYGECNACTSTEGLKKLLIGPDRSSMSIKLCKVCADKVIITLGGAVFHGCDIGTADHSKIYNLGEWKTEKQDHYPKDWKVQLKNGSTIYGRKPKLGVDHE